MRRGGGGEKVRDLNLGSTILSITHDHLRLKERASVFVCVCVRAHLCVCIIKKILLNFPTHSVSLPPPTSNKTTHTHRATRTQTSTTSSKSCTHIVDKPVVILEVHVIIHDRDLRDWLVLWRTEGRVAVRHHSIVKWTFPAPCCIPHFFSWPEKYCDGCVAFARAATRVTVTQS